MPGLKSVLEEVSREQFKQGGALSDATIAALRQYRKRAGTISAIVLSVVVVGVIVTLCASAYYLNNPTNLKVVVSGLGMSLSAALLMLRSSWKDWNQSNLLLILVEEANEAEVRALLDTLIKRL